MAKVACPACGAMNGSKFYKCRLCGRVLEIADDPTPFFRTQPRDVITGRPKYGVGVLVWLGAALLGLLLATLFTLGAIENDYVDRAITVLDNQKTSDTPGWIEVTPEGAGFSAALPGNQERLTEQEGALPSLFVNSTMLTGSFDDFDKVYVAWGTLAVPRSESDLVTLERAAEAYAAEREGIVQNFTFGLTQDKPTATFDVVYRGIDPRYTKAFISIDGEKGWLGAVDGTTDKLPLYDTFRKQYFFVS
jgi:hypothetical protein